MAVARSITALRPLGAEVPVDPERTRLRLSRRAKEREGGLPESMRRPVAPDPLPSASPPLTAAPDLRLLRPGLPWNPVQCNTLTGPVENKDIAKQVSS